MSMQETSEEAPSQIQLLESVEKDLRKLLELNGIKANHDGSYLRFISGDGKMVGGLYDSPDHGLRKVKFYLDPELHGVITAFKSLIPNGLFYHMYYTPDFVVFTFFSNLTEEEVRISQEPASSVDGNVTIVQGEYVFLGPINDASNPANSIDKVSTFGIVFCKAIIIYDPESKMVAFAHSDSEYISLILQMYNELIEKGADPDKLIFFGTPNIDKLGRYLIIDKLFKTRRYELPTEFTFDRRTGEVAPFDIGNLPEATQEELVRRLETGVHIRLKYRIPHIRRKVSN